MRILKSQGLDTREDLGLRTYDQIQFDFYRELSKRIMLFERKI